MARTRTTSILAVFLVASIVVDGGALAPEPAVQAFPTSPIWTIEVKARPVAPPASSGGRLFLALQSLVSAHRLDDGAEVWHTALEVDGPMAASDERLVVPVKGELRGLDTATGAVVWTENAGPLTAPPLVHGDWLLVTSGEQVICYRVADGTRVWSRDVGAVEQRVAVDSSRVYVPAADGRLIALELASGEPAWEFDIGIKPTEPLVYDGRVFVGSAAKRFCSLFVEGSRRKRDDWCFAVGATVIGRAAADATHVYYVALDNLLRAHDRKNGAYRWKKDLLYRPSAGPLLVGASIAAPGSVPRVEVLDTVQGKTTMQLTLATKLVTAPLLIDASAGLPTRIAGVTGGLANVWNVTLAGPAPPALPELPIAPLTELPGQVIPIGKPSAPPGSPLPTASLPRQSVPAPAPRTTTG